MKELGECDWCSEPAVMPCNQYRACRQHIENAIDAAFRPVQRIIAALNERRN